MRKEEKRKKNKDGKYESNKKKRGKLKKEGK